MEELQQIINVAVARQTEKLQVMMESHFKMFIENCMQLKKVNTPIAKSENSVNKDDRSPLSDQLANIPYVCISTFTMNLLVFLWQKNMKQ